MSLYPGPFYRFRTKQQWDCAYKAGVSETLSLDPKSGVECGAIDCPAVAAALSARGDLFWVDRCATLFAARRDPIYRGTEGPALGRILRLVAGREFLWGLVACAAPDGEPEAGARRLVQVDSRSLHILINRDAGGVIDIAGDGKDGLWLLRSGSLGRISARGAPVGRRRELDEEPAALAVARGRFALLTQDRLRLVLGDIASGDTLSFDLPSLAGPGWSGRQVRLSGAGSAFLIEGAIGTGRGFLVVDRDGNLLVQGGWRDGQAPQLLAADGDDLVGLFADAGGQLLRRFAGLARPGSERRITPALETFSPAGTWLRAETIASLPERATLTMRWAATDDLTVAETVKRTLANPTLQAKRRLELVDALLQWSPEFVYVGEAREGGAAPERFALPLHRAAGSLLWVDLKIARNSADSAPEIDSLLVLHEAQSLMDDLPAIYSGDGDRDGTMRRLVGVLEATTQDMDRRIARLAARLDPEAPCPRWLPDLAAMLGLPFHDALTEKMQRRLVGKAPDILARRGTRLGLIVMLEALFPGRAIRVVDRTEQLIPISLGRRGVGGRALPAMLAGPSIRVPKLNARLVLNRTGLCRTGICDEALLAPGPEVLVSIPARIREQQRFRDAVAQMVEAMVPAGVRVRLRWTPWRRHGAVAPADVLTILDAPERLSLGVGPALGRARTGGRAAPRLDGEGTTPANHRLL